MLNMSVEEFITLTGGHFADDEEQYLTFPYDLSKCGEDVNSIYEFARFNKDAIIGMLHRKRHTKEKGMDVAKAVQVKIIDVMRAWDKYLFDESRYLASNCRTEKPVMPSIDPADALASLDEQELAYYAARCFASSTDIEKARLGELAMMDIAESSFGYKDILVRMKQDYRELCMRRNTEAEMKKRAELCHNAESIQNMRMTG